VSHDRTLPLASMICFTFCK